MSAWNALKTVSAVALFLPASLVLTDITCLKDFVLPVLPTASPALGQANAEIVIPIIL